MIYLTIKLCKYTKYLRESTISLRKFITSSRESIEYINL